VDTLELMKRLIESRKRTKESVLQYCDVFYMAERIDAVQYQELVDQINTTYQTA
jgi:hypothetical protein